MLCSHYGCGGGQAVLTLPPDLAPLNAQEQQSEHLNRLVEVNVLAQFAWLVKTAPVLKAWRKNSDLDLFGCVDDLHSGHLKELFQQTGKVSA